MIDVDTNTNDGWPRLTLGFFGYYSFQNHHSLYHPLFISHTHIVHNACRTHHPHFQHNHSHWAKSYDPWYEAQGIPILYHHSQWGNKPLRVYHQQHFKIQRCRQATSPTQDVKSLSHHHLTTRRCPNLWRTKPRPCQLLIRDDEDGAATSRPHGGMATQSCQ